MEISSTGEASRVGSAETCSVTPDVVVGLAELFGAELVALVGSTENFLGVEVFLVNLVKTQSFSEVLAAKVVSTQLYLLQAVLVET